VYDGTDWRQTVLDSPPLGIERILNTAGQAGGSNFSWAPFSIYTSGSPDTWEHLGYCVAFERRSHEGDIAKVSVVVQRYDKNGVFVDETTVVAADGGSMFGPIVQPVEKDGSGNALCRIYFTSSTQYRLYTTFAKSDFSVTIPDGSPVYTNVGGGALQAEYDYPWGGAGATIEYESRRVGITRNAQLQSSFRWKQDIAAGEGVIGWNAEGVIKVQVVDLHGLPIGNINSRHNSTSAASVYSILDVDIDANNVYVMVARFDTTNTNGDVTVTIDKIARPLALGGSATTNELTVSSAGTCPQGTIKVHTNGNVVYAYTFVGGDINKRHDNRDDAIRWGTVLSDFGSRASTGKLRNHRIVSNIQIDKNGYPILVVQQFGNYTPWVKGGSGIAGGANKLHANTFPDVKPVTSALVRLLAGGKHTVVATFDAGQSKDKDASYAEMNTGLSNLYYMDSVDDGLGGEWVHSHWYGNRNALTIEDYSCMLFSEGTLSTTDADAMVSLMVGESRFNLYLVAYDLPLEGQSIGDGFVLNSAIPLWYSGGAIAEMSVLDQPEIVGFATLSGDSDNIRSVGYNASLDPGAYKVFQAVTGYFDQSGKAHRSAPSFPLFISILEASDASTGLIKNIRFYITKPLSCTDGKVDYFAEIYAANIGEEPQLAGTLSFDASNHDDAIYIHAQIGLTPSTDIDEYNVVRQSETLYTTGNVLPSDAWPNIKHITSTSRRMFATSVSSPGVIFYSKIFEEGLAPEFSAALVISMGASKELTAIGTVDDKVIVFEKDAMHLLYGTGPDNTGANGDFFVERIESPIGCEDQESLVTTPDGLMFYSSVSQEFHLISRDMQIIDIGRPVSDVTEGIDIKASVLYPEEHEVRFYVTGSGSSDWGDDPDTGDDIPDRPPRPRYGRSLPVAPALVYNYQYQKWTVLTHRSISAATLYQNKPAVLTGSWYLFQVTDNWANSRPMKWETPWIKVNQLQDYGRFWEATFLGKYLSAWKDDGDGFEAGDLKVTVKYDYEGMNGTEDVYKFRANVDFDPTDGERLQFKVFPGRQKCQAIKFLIEEQNTESIEESEPNYTLGRGFELTSIDLVYGAKGGSSRNFGTRRQK
jgi:hypothetical protein